MAKKNITIDKLAMMVQKGFNDVTNKMATKSEMNLGFKKVNKQLSDIRDVLIRKHTEEIQYLKERVNKLEDALAIE